MGAFSRLILRRFLLTPRRPGERRAPYPPM
jgi:hypothetical protein